LSKNETPQISKRQTSNASLLKKKKLVVKNIIISNSNLSNCNLIIGDNQIKLLDP
jgi:hypothetical protein